MMTTTMEFFARTCFYDVSCFIPSQRRRAVSTRGLTQRRNTTFTACEPCAARRCLPHPLRAALRAWGSRLSRCRWPLWSAWQPRPSRACVRCCTRAYSYVVQRLATAPFVGALASSQRPPRRRPDRGSRRAHPSVGMLLTDTFHFSIQASKAELEPSDTSGRASPRRDVGPSRPHVAASKRTDKLASHLRQPPRARPWTGATRPAYAAAGAAAAGPCRARGLSRASALGAHRPTRRAAAQRSESRRQRRRCRSRVCRTCHSSEEHAASARGPRCAYVCSGGRPSARQ